MIHTLGLSPSLDVVYEVESIRAGTIHRPRTVLRLAGGKSLNVSRALVRLGHRVRAIAPLGGRIGDLVADELAGTGVDLVRVPSSVSTRMCVSAADESARTLTEFYEHAAPADGTELGPVADALDEIRPGEWLALSGSVPPGTDLERLVAVLAACSARGVRLALDTHGPVLARALERAGPALLKVNRAEAAELVGRGDADLTALGAEVRRRTDAVVVLTDGPAGATGWGAGEAWSVRTDVAPGGFPVGSGDCFLAGLVADLADDVVWPQALVSAAAVGAANAAVPGGAIFAAEAVASMRAATRLLQRSP